MAAIDIRRPIHRNGGGESGSSRAVPEADGIIRGGDEVRARLQNDRRGGLQ